MLFSGCRGEVENVSANQGPRRPFWSSDRPEKHKLGTGVQIMIPGQVSMDSVLRLQRRIRKCLSQSEASTAILVFRLTKKNTNLAEEVEILLPIKFPRILFSGCKEEVVNVSANQRPGQRFWLSD